MGQMTAPCHPGEILRHEFLEPLGVSAIDLAKAIGVPRTRIERLVKERTGVTPDTALRLSRALGTTPEFWIDMQANHDSYVHNKSKLKKGSLAAARRNVDVSGIAPLVAA